MTPEERAALQAELDALRRRLVKREDQPGFAANVAQIRGRIAELEAALAE